MKTQEKRKKVKSLALNMLKQSQKAMAVNIEKLLSSGAIDIDKWDEGNAPMILPKCIIAAVLENEATQYRARGTSYEKLVKREIKNMLYFI